MSRTFAVFSVVMLVCLCLSALGGLVWANSVFVRSLPVEKDFLVPWLGARTFIQYGESPYSDPATQRAQIIYYGRLASAGQDPLILGLPFPFELFYFPFALIADYVLARAVWMTCLEIALVALGILSLRLTGWKPGRIFLPVVLLFQLFWVYGVFSLGSGNASGFVALALVGFLLALKGERDELAGGLLILLVGAPRLTGILVFFVLWWIIYQRRWRIIWGFLMGLVILIGLAFLFLPDWPTTFLTGLISHSVYNPLPSSTAIFASWSPVVGLRLGWMLAAGLLLGLFLAWGNSLRKDYRAFLWTVSLTLTVTPLLGIPLAPAEYPFLIVPLMLCMVILVERRPWLKQWGAIGILLVIFLACPWILIFSLVRANAFTAVNNGLFLFLPVTLIIVLVWMRWWFFHTVPTGMEAVP
jgi:hypothetical protein